MYNFPCCKNEGQLIYAKAETKMLCTEITILMNYGVGILKSQQLKRWGKSQNILAHTEFYYNNFLIYYEIAKNSLKFDIFPSKQKKVKTKEVMKI